MTDQRTIQLHPQHFEIIEAFKTLGKAYLDGSESFVGSLELIDQAPQGNKAEAAYWAVEFARDLLEKLG